MITPATLEENQTSNIVSKITEIYNAWSKLQQVLSQGRRLGRSFQKAIASFQKGFLGTPIRLYRNGTLYKFCTRDKKTFSVCTQLALQLFAAVGTPSTAAAIQQMVRTLATNPKFSIEFVNVAVVPPLLKASTKLGADQTEIVNEVLEGIFGPEVTLKTIRSYTTADLQNKFQAKHLNVLKTVATRPYQQTTSAGHLVKDSRSFSPVKSESHHHHTCPESTNHHCAGCCSCECCGAPRKYHRHYRTHRFPYWFVDEDDDGYRLR